MASLALSMPSLSDPKSKRSFEFRMCKKVAELTQVIHMLFTRNHQKEIEMEALTEAYEFEICEIISDAKTRIAKLEKEQENMLKQQNGDVERIRKLLEGEFRSKEQELQRRLEVSEKQALEERAESQKLRDLLIRAQMDIESLRQGASDQKTSLDEELAQRDGEIERLRKQVQQLEQSLESRERESSETIKDLGRVKDSLERELRHVHELLEEHQGSRQKLQARNKQLESELKDVKKDFNRKVAEMMKERFAKNGETVSATQQSQNQNEELERLRREIQRYRLELSNRDANFNRMFTDKQPIHLDHRTSGSSAVMTSFSSGGGGGGDGGGLRKHAVCHSTGTLHPTMVTLKKERIFVPMKCFQEQDHPPPTHPLLHSERQRAMSSPSTHRDARDSRFPCISASPDLKPRPSRDHKPRPFQDSKVRQSSGSASNGRMSKPRQLPKEMLFGE